MNSASPALPACLALGLLLAGAGAAAARDVKLVAKWTLAHDRKEGKPLTDRDRYNALILVFQEAGSTREVRGGFRFFTGR